MGFLAATSFFVAYSFLIRRLAQPPARLHTPCTKGKGMPPS
jgi:hypothetical protein